jgi:hypothetical protein
MLRHLDKVLAAWRNSRRSWAIEPCSHSRPVGAGHPLVIKLLLLPLRILIDAVRVLDAVVLPRIVIERTRWCFELCLVWRHDHVSVDLAPLVLVFHDAARVVSLAIAGSQDVDRASVRRFCPVDFVILLGVRGNVIV